MLLQDVRHGFRLLRRTPGFTAVAVRRPGARHRRQHRGLFDRQHADPAAAAGPDRQRWSRSSIAIASRPRTSTISPIPPISICATAAACFESLLAHSFTTIGIRDGELTRQAFATIVSSNYFETLGVGLAAGRTFPADEERPGSRRDGRDRVVCRCGGAEQFDPRFIGSTVRINGADFTVVGVTPRGFGGRVRVRLAAVVAADRLLRDHRQRDVQGQRQRAERTEEPRAESCRRAETRRDRRRGDDRARRRSRSSLDAQYPGTDRDRTFPVSSLPRMSVQLAAAERRSVDGGRRAADADGRAGARGGLPEPRQPAAGARCGAAEGDGGAPGARRRARGRSSSSSSSKA